MNLKRERLTPKETERRIVILSHLLKGPQRRKRLWEAVRYFFKGSSNAFDEALKGLVKEGLIARDRISHKNVNYSISQTARTSHPRMLDLAGHVSSISPYDYIFHCMDWLAQAEIFNSKTEAVKAALDFWVVRYRNLCVMNALNCLSIDQFPGLQLADKNANLTLKGAWRLRQIYRSSEDRFFEILLRFAQKYTKEVEAIQEKMPPTGISLRTSWLVFRLVDLLETHYPNAYEKLQSLPRGEATVSFFLKRKAEGEIMICDHPDIRGMYFDGVCYFCHRHVPDGQVCCIYRKIPTVGEQIRLRRMKLGKESYYTRYGD